MATEPVYEVHLDGERAVIVDATRYTDDATFAIPGDEGVLAILPPAAVKNILLDWYFKEMSRLCQIQKSSDHGK